MPAAKTEGMLTVDELKKPAEYSVALANIVPPEFVKNFIGLAYGDIGSPLAVCWATAVVFSYSH